MIDSKNHPYVDLKVMDGYERIGTIKAHIAGDFRVDFDHCSIWKTEKEIRRMIALYERFEEERKKEKK